MVLFFALKVCWNTYFYSGVGLVTRIAATSKSGVCLVTRIAATSKSQIASDCNRKSKYHCDSATLWSQLFGLGIHQFCVVFIVFQKGHIGQENPAEIVAYYKGVIPNRSDFFGPMRFCDCDTSISLRFLQEKLATSKLWLPIASDLWLRLRGSLRLFEHQPKFAKKRAPPKTITFHSVQNTGYKKNALLQPPSWPKIGVFKFVLFET